LAFIAKKDFEGKFLGADGAGGINVFPSAFLLRVSNIKKHHPLGMVLVKFA
jgi:hypothetical protein